MGIIDTLIGKRIFLDTSPLIYYIESNNKYSKYLDKIFNLNEKGKIEFITSSLTLLEVLVQPLRLGKFDIVEKYEFILTESELIDIIDLNIHISKTAAELRAKYSFKTPDAIQLATALETNCNIFLTNDKELKVENIEILQIDSFFL